MAQICDFATVNGTRLYYEMDGAGRPVVFIHGFGLDARMWDVQFSYFAEHYLVIRYDLRGFGRSALPSSQEYSHTRDLNALMTYLGIEHACIVGLSRGGRWAIQFALDHKQSIDALIVVDAMPNGFIRRGEKPSMAREIVAKARLGDMQAAKDLWYEQPIFANVRKNSELNSLLYQMIMEYSGWHWLNQDPLILEGPPAVQRLGEITSPTLVIVGEEDIEDFRRAGDYLCQEISNARKETLRGVGHMANMEAPHIFNEIVSKFLDGQLSSGVRL